MSKEFSIFEVISMREASDIWGLTPRAIQLRLMRQDNKHDGTPLIRLSGGVWLTTISAMVKVYGQPKNERKDYEV